MFDSLFNVSAGQKFLAELNLLKEKPLHSFLIGEIWNYLLRLDQPIFLAEFSYIKNLSEQTMISLQRMAENGLFLIKSFFYGTA